MLANLEWRTTCAGAVRELNKAPFCTPPLGAVRHESSNVFRSRTLGHHILDVLEKFVPSDPQDLAEIERLVVQNRGLLRLDLGESFFAALPPLALQLRGDLLQAPAAGNTNRMERWTERVL